VDCTSRRADIAGGTRWPRETASPGFDRFTSRMGTVKAARFHLIEQRGGFARYHLRSGRILSAASLRSIEAVPSRTAVCAGVGFPPAFGERFQRDLLAWRRRRRPGDLDQEWIAAIGRRWPRRSDSRIRRDDVGNPFKMACIAIGTGSRGGELIACWIACYSESASCPAYPRGRARVVSLCLFDISSSRQRSCPRK